MIQLYNDDCYEKIKDIPDNSVDLVIIDPPYLFNNGKYPYHLEIASLSSGFDFSILDELCRVQERINAYVWCSKSQLQDLFNYYDDRRCAINLLTWHKTNPTPLCNNTYLSDTEYCVFVRQRGVKLYGNYHTKKKYWVTPANVADKKRYGGHPTIKPLNIIENLITNSSLPGGGRTRLLYGFRNYWSCRKEARP